MFEYLFLHLKKGTIWENKNLWQKCYFYHSRLENGVLTTFPWGIWAKRSELGWEKAHLCNNFFSNIKGASSKLFFDRDVMVYFLFRCSTSSSTIKPRLGVTHRREPSNGQKWGRKLKSWQRAGKDIKQKSL